MPCNHAEWLPVHEVGGLGRLARSVCLAWGPKARGMVWAAVPDKLPVMHLRGLRVAPQARGRAVPLARSSGMEVHGPSRHTCLAPAPI